MPGKCINEGSMRLCACLPESRALMWIEPDVMWPDSLMLRFPRSSVLNQDSVLRSSKIMSANQGRNPGISSLYVT